jgi:hypothetical protein
MIEEIVVDLYARLIELNSQLVRLINLFEIYIIGENQIYK